MWDDPVGYDNRITIERMTNGYTVRVCDPKIQEANRKRDTKSGSINVPYRDPYREYVFKTIGEATSFVAKVADKALPKDDYESSFDAACEEGEEGDE